MSNNNKPENRNKLNFLFVSADKYPPFRVDVSVLFGEEMVKQGHNIDWVLQSAEPCNRAYQTTWSGCKVWVGATDEGASKLSRLKKHSLSIINDAHIFKLVKKGHYDFIQVKDKFIAAIFAVIAAKLYKTKFIYWISYPFPEASLYYASHGLARYPVLYKIRGHFNKWLLYKFLCPKADHIYVQSMQMKKDFAEEGVPLEKMTAIPMGVSIDAFPNEPSSNASPAENDCNKIVYLGTLNQSRKMDFLVRAFALVIKEIPNSILYMVGGGDKEDDIQVLKQECERLDIMDKVIFTGFQEREKAFEFVEMSNVCVSPFYPTAILNSTSPTKIVEYMAMKKPIVANDHPEQKLIIEQSKAGICVPYSENEFALAIIDLLNNPEKAKEMGLLGRQYVEQNRSYHIIAKLVEKTYYEICGT